MFESVRELWISYRLSYAHLWPPPDARGDLAAEVENRLEQLDILLEHLYRALAAVRPDPTLAKAHAEFFLREATRYQNGEITGEEYEALIRSRPMLVPEYSRPAWSEIRLFTEAFYFFAWRVREILSTSGPRAFPGVSKVSAAGINKVRNLLLEHPEKRKQGPINIQALVVTDDGPVLKSTSFMVKGDKAVADPESIDQGLFQNAEEFRDELQSKLSRAISIGAGRS